MACPTLPKKWSAKYVNGIETDIEIVSASVERGTATSGSEVLDDVVFHPEVTDVENNIPMAASGSNPNPDTSILEDLSPRDLVNASQKLLGEGDVEKSEAALKLALSKDSEYIHGLRAMGALLMQRGQFAEALSFLERIKAKPSIEDLLDFTIARLATPQMAASCCLKLGKPIEAIGWLKPLARMDEPSHPIAKDHYTEGIGMLGGIYFKVGRVDDAVECEKMMLAKIGPDRYTTRISHLSPKYADFVLRYV